MSGFENLPDDVLLSMMEDPSFDYDDDHWKNQAETYMADQVMLDSVDIITGAPVGVRAQVNAAQSEEDRLLTLRQFYPDAIRVEDLSPTFGAEQFGSGNFVYTEPQTGRLILFDEREGFLFGASLKDITADIGPELAETVGAIGGGIGGGILGAPLGPVGIAGGIIAGEGVGSASARELYIGILNHFGETQDNRTLGELGTDYVFTAGINSAGGPILSKIGQGLRFASDGVRLVAGGMNKSAREAYKRISSIISQPTAGQVTMNPIINLMETVAEKLPASTKTMHEVAKRTLVEIERYGAELAERYGGVRTTTEAAEGLFKKGEEGVPSGSVRQAKERYTNEVNTKYAKVNELLPSSTMNNIDNTMALVEDFVTTGRTAVGSRQADVGLAEAELILKDFKEGVLTFENLRNFRTQLLTDTRTPLANATTSNSQKQQLKRLIGAVTGDLDNHVTSFGDDVLTKAYKEANEFVAKNQGPGGDITFINKLLDKAEVELEPALNSLLQGAKDGPSKILKLKNKLTKEEFALLPGYILGRMGMRTPGMSEGVELGVETGAEYITKRGFSPNTFIKNWESLSKEAKDVLFTGSEFDGLAKELDNLVFTVNRIKQAGRTTANPSNSAQIMYGMGLFGPGALGAMATFEAGFGSLVLPYGGAKLLTNKSFVRWLAEGVELAATNPNSYGNHLRKLIQIQAVNPEIRNEIRAILEGHQGESLQPIPEQHSSSLNIQPMNNNEFLFRQAVGEEVADKVLPDNTRLAENIDAVQVPQIDRPLFEPEADLMPQELLSPTILPDERDREIAMRQQLGIAGLV